MGMWGQGAECCPHVPLATLEFSESFMVLDALSSAWWEKGRLLALVPMSWEGTCD